MLDQDNIRKCEEERADDFNLHVLLTVWFIEKIGAPFETNHKFTLNRVKQMQFQIAFNTFNTENTSIKTCYL